MAPIEIPFTDFKPLDGDVPTKSEVEAAILQNQPGIAHTINDDKVILNRDFIYGKQPWINKIKDFIKRTRDDIIRINQSQSPGVPPVVQPVVQPAVLPVGQQPNQPQNPTIITSTDTDPTNNQTYVNLQNTITLIVAGLLGASLISDFLLNIQFDLGIYSGKLTSSDLVLGGIYNDSQTNLFISVPDITIFGFNPKRNNRNFSIQYKKTLTTAYGDASNSVPSAGTATATVIGGAGTAAPIIRQPDQLNKEIIGQSPSKILIDVNNLMQITNVDEVYEKIKSGDLLFNSDIHAKNGSVDSVPAGFDINSPTVIDATLLKDNYDINQPTKSSLLAKVIRKVYSDYKNNQIANQPNPTTGEYIRYKVEALLFFSKGKMTCKINLVEALEDPSPQIISDTSGSTLGKEAFLNWVSTVPVTIGGGTGSNLNTPPPIPPPNSVHEYDPTKVVPVIVKDDLVDPIQIPRLEIKFNGVEPTKQNEILGKMNTSLGSISGGGLFGSNYATYMVHPNIYRNRRVYRKRGRYTKKRSNVKSRNQRKSRR